MTERPILFSAPMVHAILEGRKTQTRRVIKPQPNEDQKFTGTVVESTDSKHEGCVRFHNGLFGFEHSPTYVKFPYGQVGDSLLAIECRGVVDVETTDPPLMFPRINLEITDLSVERLQDISEADAMAEGANPMLVPPDGGSCPHIEGFRDLWESIYGVGSWDANPWVWVIEFKRVKP